MSHVAHRARPRAAARARRHAGRPRRRARPAAPSEVVLHHGGQPGGGRVGAGPHRDGRAQAGEARRPATPSCSRRASSRATSAPIVEPGEPPLPARRDRALRAATRAIHVSGHASQEELKLVLNLVRPRHFVPVHGEYRHLVRHLRARAPRWACPPTAAICSRTATCSSSTAAARRAPSACPRGACFVDGKGVGDVGDVVLRDRRHLSEDGLVLAVLAIAQQSGDLVAGPDLVSRGVVAEEASARGVRRRARRGPRGAGRHQPRVAHRPGRGQGGGPEGTTAIFQEVGPPARDPPLRARDVVATSGTRSLVVG